VIGFVVKHRQVLSSSSGGGEEAETAPDVVGVVFKLLPRPFLPSHVQPEAIAFDARKHVQVRVEHRLKRRFAVGEEEVHPLARQS
jgi:hypothetical protein